MEDNLFYIDNSILKKSTYLFKFEYECRKNLNVIQNTNLNKLYVENIKF